MGHLLSGVPHDILFVERMNSHAPEQQPLPAKAELPAPPGVVCSDIVRCPHVERKERVIKTPNGMFMAIMECVTCGDQRAGAHHYACERYQTSNVKFDTSLR
jgi:hypothetical protein